jgi:hypothetical protein
MDDRPTREEVHEMLQRSLADAHGAASTTAAAASSAAVRPLQQQLEGLVGDVEAVKRQLQATQQELEYVKEQQVKMYSNGNSYTVCLVLSPLRSLVCSQAHISCLPALTNLP